MPCLQTEVEAERVALAMSGAVTGVMEAMALTLPCREMCVAMVETCDCGSGGNETVGSLLQWVEQQQPQVRQVDCCRDLTLGPGLWARLGVVALVGEPSGAVTGASIHAEAVTPFGAIYDSVHWQAA